MDFPSLVADGGELLETELGVKSKLHREQIIRAMKRLLLGLGVTPSVPEVMHVSVHPSQSNPLAMNLVNSAPVLGCPMSIERKEGL